MKKPQNQISASELRILEKIAAEKLGVETLETRQWDRLDFHDLGVGSIRDALHAAYQAGLAAADKKKSKIDTCIDIAAKS